MELLLPFSIHMIILFVLTREPIFDWICKFKYGLFIFIILGGGLFAFFLHRTKRNNAESKNKTSN